MTIPEAVQLVLQAAAIGRDGEALVLDMGEPVRIDDVARQLIAMSGRDVEIVFTGLRPGEKLHEELLAPGRPASAPSTRSSSASPCREAGDTVDGCAARVGAPPGRRDGGRKGRGRLPAPLRRTLTSAAATADTPTW